MTLLTAIVNHDAVLLATDTAAFGSESGRALGYSMTKALPVAHLRAVLVVQGSGVVLPFILSKASYIESMDAAESTMPQLLEAAARSLPGVIPTAANAGCRVVLAGWSASRGCVAMMWTSDDGFRTIKTAALTAGQMLVPKDAAPRKPIKSVDDFGQYILTQQMPYLRARNARIGGELVLFKVDRHGVRMTFGGDLGLPEGPSRFASPGAIDPPGQERAAAIYDPATSFNVLTVSPNTSLPDPTIVEQVTGVTVDSGATAQLDRSVLVRADVTWDPIVGQAVRQSGRVEVQWMEATATMPAGDWPGRAEAEGNATSLTVTGLRAKVGYLFRARARTTLGVRGKWSNQALHIMADVPPQTVSSISVANSGTNAFTATGSFSVTHSSVGNWTFTGDANSTLMLDVNQMLDVKFETGAVGSIVTATADIDLVWDGTAVPGRTLTLEAATYARGFDRWASFVVPIRYTGTAAQIEAIGGTPAASTHGYAIDITITMRDSSGAPLGSSISGTWESSTRNTATELLK